jgi:hypothetical protein
VKAAIATCPDALEQDERCVTLEKKKCEARSGEESNFEKCKELGFALVDPSEASIIVETDRNKGWNKAIVNNMTAVVSVVEFDSLASKQGVTLGWTVSKVNGVDVKDSLPLALERLKEAKDSEEEKIYIVFNTKHQAVCNIKDTEVKCKHQFHECVKKARALETTYFDQMRKEPTHLFRLEGKPIDEKEEKDYANWKKSKEDLFEQLRNLDREVIKVGKRGPKEKKGIQNEEVRNRFLCVLHEVLTCEELTEDLFFGAEDVCKLMLEFNDGETDHPLEFLNQGASFDDGPTKIYNSAKCTAPPPAPARDEL